MLIFSVVTSCLRKRPEEKPVVTDNTDAQLSGLELSKQYCQGCHMYPEPDLLDKNIWENYMLPRMGYMLGIYSNDSIRETLFESGPGGKKVREANTFPAEQRIDNASWEKIKAYYMVNAPDSLSKITASYQPLKQFEPIIPDYQLSPPSTTMVQFSEEGSFYIGDANSRSLLHFNANLNLLKVGKVPEGAVHIHETKQHLWVTAMGSFSPTDAPSGMLIRYPKEKGRPAVMVDSLQRPVHAAFSDLDGDGLEDVVISEFGKWTGGLSWWKQNANGTYTKNQLDHRPGAIRSYITDWNNDGLPDITALFGQGDEGITIYYNKGNGQFSIKKAIPLPSSYGSSYFNLFDYNSDGLLDILYAAGDNGDYPPILKPYHGIRIFVNKGEETFEEVYFYPLHGAYNAIPKDFDLDGDMDIAIISFFPDFQHHPEEAFVYLENTGDMQFTPHTLPGISNLGRWIVMDASDWDKDGDTDLILGALTFEVVPKMNYVNTWVKNGIPFIVLENKTF